MTEGSKLGRIVARLKGINLHVSNLRQINYEVVKEDGVVHLPAQDITKSSVAIEASIPCNPDRNICGGNIFRGIFSGFKSPDKLDRENLTRCANCPFALQPDGSVALKTP